MQCRPQVPGDVRAADLSVDVAPGRLRVAHRSGAVYLEGQLEAAVRPELTSWALQPESGASLLEAAALPGADVRFARQHLLPRLLPGRGHAYAGGVQAVALTLVKLRTGDAAGDDGRQCGWWRHCIVGAPDVPWEEVQAERDYSTLPAELLAEQRRQQERVAQAEDGC
jgi:hypothetical protein